MNINELGKEQENTGKTAPQADKVSEGAKPAGAAPKKKLVAVYRPQNSQQIKSRPAGQKPRTAQEGRSGAAPGAGKKEQGAGRTQKSLSLSAGKATLTPAQKTGPDKAPAAKPQEKAGTAAATEEKVDAAAAKIAETKPAAAARAAEGKAAPARTQEGAREARGSQMRESGREGRGSQDRGSYGSRDGQDRGSYGSRDGQGRGSYGSRDGGQGRGGYGNRDGQSGGYQNREGRGGQGGYASRDGGQGRGGYGNRDGQDRGGYASRDGGQGRGGYGNRDGQSGGYQNREGRGGQGGFGNRDGQGGGYGNRGGQGGFGNRDGQGGYGNRGGQGGFGNRGGQGGFGNRDGQGGFGNRGGQGGFGNRDSQGGGYGNRGGQGGFQGNRSGQGGFQGRGGQGGAFGGRDGGRSGGPGRNQGNAKSAFDSPLQSKPTTNRQNKNAYKNDRYEKKNLDAKEGRLKGGKPAKGAFIMPPKPVKEKEEVKVIVIPEVITIKELAEKMKVQPSVIVGKLFKEKGQMVTVNQEVDYEQAEEIAMEFDILCEKEEKVDVIAELLKEAEENEEDMSPRPPVVCVMGHVDHGKTSLLDAIRKTNVTAKEAGGITQHIGAYMVEINGQKITFLDTPGHEAFTAMRMRGAQSTDIAILVVAADDGVMPQTVEAINHAKAAGVEIIVAVNKIDKPSANVDRVKQEMSEYELIAEDWGGSTIFVPVSAHTQEGIKELLEMVLLTAEVKELKANPDRKARGLVIEAELDKGKGPVATVLVQKGTLHVGDNVAVGACFGKVRAMMDDKGRRVKEAGPSTPVEILGLNDVPNAGEIFVATENEKEARAFADTFISEEKNRLIDDTKAKLSLDALFSQIKAGNVKELPIIIKADVQGSVEAVKQSLVKLSNEEVMVKVIHGGVGAINESDVNLASASNAIIIGFNVRPDVTAKSIAEREKVDVRLYKVIYQAIEDVEAAMKGMLDPIFEEKVIGHGVVRQTFKASGVGTIAGSYVLDGQFTRGCSARITRDGEQIFDGPLASLKRFKDDVKEVKAGYECGLVFEKFNDLQEDDMIEAYAMVEVPR